MSVVFMEQDVDHYFFDSERQLDENQSIRVEKGVPVYFRIECADDVIDKIYPTTTGDREGELEKHQADDASYYSIMPTTDMTISIITEPVQISLNYSEDAIEILRVSADSDDQVLFLAEEKSRLQ